MIKKITATIAITALTGSLLLTGCATNDKQAPVVDAVGPTKEGSGLDLRDNFDSKSLAQAQKEISNPSKYTPEERKQLAKKLMDVKNVMYFDFDSYELSDKSKENSEKIAVILKEHPHQTLRIAGHTDPRGSEDYNFNLGQQRAVAVQEYLVEQGANAEQVCTVSYGELQLAATPEDHNGNAKKAHQQNRRVVLYFGENCEETDQQ